LPPTQPTGHRTGSMFLKDSFSSLISQLTTVPGVTCYTASMAADSQVPVLGSTITRRQLSNRCTSKQSSASSCRQYSLTEIRFHEIYFHGGGGECSRCSCCCCEAILLLMLRSSSACDLITRVQCDPHLGWRAYRCK
jgi:hypothetical protein